MKDLSCASSLEMMNWLEKELKDKSKLEFIVFNPDYAGSTYAGKNFEIDGNPYIYRGYKAYTDLAQVLFCKMLTPRSVNEHKVIISLEKLDCENSFHKSVKSEEKYGVESPFFEINKNEEPAFLFAYRQALENVKIKNRKQVLDLGVNRGDEFDLIKKLLTSEQFEKMKFIGVDYSASAIEFAKKRFPEKNISFFEHDINKLDDLGLERSDLIISIGTFQSPNIDFKPFFLSLVQNYLSKDGALILGFPNSRWMGGEMVYGAKVPNYEMSEMSLLYKDVVYCKKYLQQKKFRVTLTGKDYIFLTATRIGG